MTKLQLDTELEKVRWFFLQQGMDALVLARIPQDTLEYHVKRGESPARIWAICNGQPIFADESVDPTTYWGV